MFIRLNLYYCKIIFFSINIYTNHKFNLNENIKLVFINYNLMATTNTNMENLNNCIKEIILDNFSELIQGRLYYAQGREGWGDTNETFNLDKFINQFIALEYDEGLGCKEGSYMMIGNVHALFNKLTSIETSRLIHDTILYYNTGTGDNMLNPYYCEDPYDFTNKIIDVYFCNQAQNFISDFRFGCDLDADYEGSYYERWNRLENIFIKIVKKDRKIRKYKKLYNMAYKLEIKNELMKTTLTEDIICKIIKML